MRFNNEDYLKAFPREEREAAEVVKQSDKPGNVLENVEQPAAADPEPAGEPEADQGGVEDGNE